MLEKWELIFHDYHHHHYHHRRRHVLWMEDVGLPSPSPPPLSFILETKLDRREIYCLIQDEPNCLHCTTERTQDRPHYFLSVFPN